ncbi:hypothetical protein IEQ34_010533 [Dendrobium chrysotoxum]|uniref:Cation/H(+) antiporter C-terminal domain-containing protein n=1 Tax=Dendrobium chrysotoxum TaxID=161865 RepID=A0AAV7GDN2_DENCH|nr:hypothetical protein IEQ34_010533 [Dendrobium chrysotoxum]
MVDVTGENDDECFAQFQADGGGEAEYVERIVGNAEETVAMLREMAWRYDLCIVGIGEGMPSPLTAELTEWSECEELGPIGDLLASPDFRSRASVLVLQWGKYREGSEIEMSGGARLVSMPASPGK